MRIISLLPSATELLCAIEGGGEMLVGRSHECDFPRDVERLPVLTAQRTGNGQGGSAGIDREVAAALAQGQSLYTLDEDLLRDLAPDLILTQDLCEVCSIDLRTVHRAAEGMRPQPRVLSLNPASLEDVFDDVLRVGEAAGIPANAQRAMVNLRGRYWQARDFINPYEAGPEEAFLEWMNPLFVGGHWTPQLIEEAGGRHSLNPPRAKSLRIEPEELLSAQPERIIICPCGYSLAQVKEHLHEVTGTEWWRAWREGDRHRRPGSPSRAARVALVDGSQMFNRPGPRLVDAFEWLVSWLNNRPEIAPLGFPAEEMPL